MLITNIDLNTLIILLQIVNSNFSFFNMFQFAFNFIYFRTTEKDTSYFILQKRKGHGNSKTLFSSLVGTIDSVFDTRPSPYRILYKCCSNIFYGEI